MAKKNRTALKSHFNTGDVPTEAHFAELIDSAALVTENQPRYQYTQMGKAFASSDGVGDVSAKWPHGTLLYDASTDEFILFYVTTDGHDIGKASVLMRRKPSDAESFSAPQVIASDQLNVSYRCHSAGIATNGDYIAIITTQGWGTTHAGMTGTYVYRSTDNGATFTSAELQLGGSIVVAKDATGFLVTQSGRIIISALDGGASSGGAFLYSDDNGSTWAECSISGTPGEITEPAWCDLGSNRLIAMVRVGTSGNFSVKSPAKFMKSDDNGSTWTAPANSASILDYTASNGEMIVDRDHETVEFLHHSRYTRDDDYSSLYVARASFEDAWADSFGSQIRIGKLAAYTTLGDSTGDSGYVSAKLAVNGVINVFFYTGKRTSAQISWMIGTPDTSYNAGRIIDFNTGEFMTHADLVTP